MPREFPTHTRLGQTIALLGYTATEFASLSGIHPRTLTEILAGRKVMTTGQLMSAAQILGVDVDDITD